jgi:nickel-type superoxide dismutase maturation protease
MGPSRRFLRRAFPALVLVALAGAVLWVLARVVRRVTVEGRSMEPALLPGDRLVVVPGLSLHRGDIVAVFDPRHRRRLLVKRITSVDPCQGLISVEGDNLDQSTDSRVFGPVSRETVVGRAVYRYAPAARAGPVGRGR